MSLEMRRAAARLPYEEKLRRVAELIELSRRLQKTKTESPPRADLEPQPANCISRTPC